MTIFGGWNLIRRFEKNKFESIFLRIFTYALIRKKLENRNWTAKVGAVRDTAMLGSDAIMDKMWPKENAAFAMIILENTNTTKFIPPQPNLTML